jgi:hypothetical protein
MGLRALGHRAVMTSVGESEDGGRGKFLAKVSKGFATNCENNQIHGCVRNAF